jgi:hypothetical protein
MFEAAQQRLAYFTTSSESIPMTVGDGKKTYRWLWMIAVIGCLGLITTAGLLHDQHRTVTRRMGWKCVTVEDKGNVQRPHIEVAAFWFWDNPHFEERAMGPMLCADLQTSGVSDVEMTFDTWGNLFWGFHGYNTTKLTASGKEIVLYDNWSGGFHDDEGHYGSFSYVEDKKQHPEKYKFPVDTFTP